MKTQIDNTKLKQRAEKLIKDFQFSKEITPKIAKQCALITVNREINTVMSGYLLNDKEVSEFQIKMRDYLVEFKQEIEKL